jgi:hypothetical protein
MRRLEKLVDYYPRHGGLGRKHECWYNDNAENCVLIQREEQANLPSSKGTRRRAIICDVKGVEKSFESLSRGRRPALGSGTICSATRMCFATARRTIV